MNFSLFMVVSCCLDCLLPVFFLNASSILRFDIRTQIAVNEVSEPIFNRAAGRAALVTETRLVKGRAAGQVDG
jgi:hypothetical protein